MKRAKSPLPEVLETERHDHDEGLRTLVSIGGSEKCEVMAGQHVFVSQALQDLSFAHYRIALLWPGDGTLHHFESEQRSIFASGLHNSAICAAPERRAIIHLVRLHVC